MSNNEQAILLILIFLFPILGLLINSAKTPKFKEFRKLNVWFLGLICIGTLLLVINHVLSGSLAGANFTISNVFLGFDAKAGFAITPLSSICAFAFSLAVLFFHLVTNNSHEELSTYSTVQNIDYPQKRAYTGLSYIILLTFFICIFSQGILGFSLGFVGFSVLNLFLTQIDSKKRVKIFIGNIIADMLIILVLTVFISSLAILSEFLIIIIGSAAIVAILYKCSLPPFNWHKSYLKKDEQFLFVSLVRPALIFVFFQVFRKLIFASNITIILLIIFITAIIIKALIQLFLSQNLNDIFENASIFSVAVFMFLCLSNQLETTFLAFISVQFGLLLLLLSISLLVGNNTRIFKSERRADIFKFNKLGGLSNKQPIIFGLFLLSWFSIAGLAPLSNGLSKFSFAFDSETFVTNTGNFLHKLISFEIAIFGLLFMLIFAGFTKLIFFGKYRGNPHKLVDIIPPKNKFIFPGIIISIILIFSGFLYLPDSSGYSQLLPAFLGDFKNNGLALDFVTFLGVSRLSIILIHFVLMVAFCFAVVFFWKNHNLRNMIKIKRKFNKLIQVEMNFENTLKKIKNTYQQLAKIHFVLVERIIFDFLFWHVGISVIQFSKKLLAKFNAGNQHSDLNYIFWGIFIFFLMAMLIILL